MRAVLISIRPKWCEKIINGDKTIEVRKTRPKLETPFKCYIYCTKDKHLAFMQNRFGTKLIACMDAETAIPVGGTLGNGKIIGEFTCDRIDRLAPTNEPYGIYDIDDDYVLQTCLENGALWDYGHGTPLYGWHISGLRIYDAPRELSEFTGLRTFKGGFELREIDRPPQSWCYVEVMEDV
jgi:predicted transcriptional regulator